MKNKIVVGCILFLMAACGSAKKDNDVISQKAEAKTGKEIVLVKVGNDSRCPEGVQCVWAGEVVFEVAAYEDKKLVEQKEFTLNRTTAEEIKTWFKQRLPGHPKELKAIQVLPYPKEGVTLHPEDYFIKLDY